MPITHPSHDGEAGAALRERLRDQVKERRANERTSGERNQPTKVPAQELRSLREDRHAEQRQRRNHGHHA